VPTIFLHEYVTGGGMADRPMPPSWAVEGAAMRRALAEDFAGLPGYRVVMTLDARLPEENGPWTLVCVGPGEEPETFARLAASCDHTLCIAPETSGLLRARAEIIESVGGHSLGCAPAAIALSGDKLRLAEYLEVRNVPTPRTVPANDVPHDWPFPAILKPIDGAGCLDTYKLGSRDDLERMTDDRSGMLLQPWVRGKPISASVLILQGPIWCDLASQEIDWDQGALVYRGGETPIEDPGGAKALALRVARLVPGLRGWVGMDMIVADEGGPVLIEINPRPTTSYIGLRHRWPPAALAAAWLGGPLPVNVGGPLKAPDRVRFDAFGNVSIEGARA
jgi:predicted ATP-grasp superfamily ATP-dependent carboligase